MIPSDWRPHRRALDDELVGYLVPAADGVIPTTLIGVPLGPALDPDAAAVVLDERGLAVLSHRWFCRLPSPLPATEVDATSPQPEWDWHAVVIIESSPALCRVRLEWAEPHEIVRSFALPVPVGDLLRAVSP